MECSYYAELEIPPSASAEQVKAAYRRLALLHHPDKNPSGAAASAEKFNRISQAFSVLRDPKSRADYDESRSTGRRGHCATAPKLSRQSSFSFAKAQLLFQEVFGELPSLAGAAQGLASATGLTACAETVGRLETVREAVAEHKDWIAQGAGAEVEEKLRIERKCRKEVEQLLSRLQEHESSLAAAHELRKNRTFSLGEDLWEWLHGERKAADDCFDNYAAVETRCLKKELRSAESVWEESLRLLSEARAAAKAARQEVSRVRKSGVVSLSEAANASTFLLGSFARAAGAEKGEGSNKLRVRIQRDLVARKWSEHQTYV